MGGLLYKDFVSIDRINKIRLTWVIATYSILFLILRIVFPGTKEFQDSMIMIEDGSVINLFDIFFIMAYVPFIILPMSFMSVSKLMSNDEKNKIGNYLNSMPFDKNTYVASKYVFIGISAYLIMSFGYILGIGCIAFCKEGLLQDIAVMVNSFLVSIISIVLFLAGIELPLYIGVGKEKAMRAMVVFWTTIAFIVIGFLMFGDLSTVSDWDIAVFMDFVEDHKSEVLIFQSLEPVIILGLYFVSYLISCRLYRRKER